jgi:hypothetical protein
MPTIELGIDCFNAVLHFGGTVQIMQRTPGTNFKRPGRRTVKGVQSTDDHVQVFHIPGFGWSLYSSPNASETKMVPIKKLRGDEHPLWQWCSAVIFRNATESSWIYYSDELQSQIEDAFQKKDSEVTFTVGLSEMRIDFSSTSVFHKQVRIAGSRTKERWVRRVLHSSEEMKELQDKLSTMCPDDQCAICLNDFAEDLLNPWKTLTCNHTFHSMCVQRMLERGSDNRCPLCRAHTMM